MKSCPRKIASLWLFVLVSKVGLSVTSLSRLCMIRFGVIVTYKLGGNLPLFSNATGGFTLVNAPGGFRVCSDFPHSQRVRPLFVLQVSHPLSAPQQPLTHYSGKLFSGRPLKLAELTLAIVRTTEPAPACVGSAELTTLSG